MTQELSKEEMELKIRSMNLESDLSQPDLLPRYSNEHNRKLQEITERFYKEMCEENAAFVVHVILPNEKEPMTLYRVCECKKPEDYQYFNDLAWRLMNSLCEFLHWFGYFKEYQRRKLEKA